MPDKEEKTDIVPVEVSVMEAQTRGEIDVQIATAKRYPRSVVKCLGGIKALAAKDTETAKECWYTLPSRGKSGPISGPSIRMAEIVASQWKNLRVQSRVTDVGEKEITCQSVCMDLENNYAVSVEVKRRITTKEGQRYSDDMIVTTQGAGISVAMRNAIFKVVPKALIKEIMDEVKQIGLGKGITMDEHKKQMFGYFKTKGITPEQIYAMLGIEGLEEVTIDHIADLKGLATAIKEGTTTLDQCFPKKDAALDKIKNKLNGGKGKDGKKGTGPEKTVAKTASKENAGKAETEKPKTGEAEKETLKESPTPESEPPVEDGEEPLL